MDGHYTPGPLRETHPKTMKRYNQNDGCAPDTVEALQETQPPPTSMSQL